MQLEFDGSVATLRLTHGKVNALDLEFMQELDRLLTEVEESAAGALVVTGQGRIFSAGVDLLRILNDGADYIDDFVRSLESGLLRLFTFPRPVVAAINGHAIAGGCLVAAAADHRLMADGGGRMGVPELLVGVPFPVVPLEVLRFAAPAAVQQLIYRGATHKAPQALTLGLVDEVVAVDALEARSRQVAEEFAAVEPQAFRLTKALLRRPAVDRIRDAASAHDAVRRCWSSAGTLDAIRSYVEATLGK